MAAAHLGKTGPFAHRNVRTYAWFTILFNARFYYPILAVFFLDLGLSLEQFVSLNAIWAATIFLAEVPSGALADLVGRKKLLQVASGLMVAEMTVLVLAPKDAGMLLFGLCALNRILSGLAEAAASGADQALAFDTLQNEGEEDRWDEVLEVVMRWKAGAMMVAMVVGALVYDASLVTTVVPLSEEMVHRLPVAFCLVQAVAVFFVCRQFEEAAVEKKAGLREVMTQTWGAARWVFTTKTALLLVVGGLLIDGFARNFATINSEYYRNIAIPEWTFGLIAAATAPLAFFIPRVAKSLARKFSPLTMLTATAGWAGLCLWGLAQVWPYWGVVPGIALLASLWQLDFLLSRYLNALADSKQRATILSVKGLLFNVGYGLTSLGFSSLVAWERGRTDDPFQAALEWQVPAFAGLFLVYYFVAKLFGMKRRIPLKTAKRTPT